MYLKSSCSGITFVASLVSANKWLLPSVGELMSLKMSFCDELLTTLLAYKGALSSMSSHMSFQISSLWKLFQAFFKGADKYFLLIFRALHFLNLSYTTVLGVLKHTWGKTNTLELAVAAVISSREGPRISSWAVSVLALRL
jgi:hypothetical protein